MKYAAFISLALLFITALSCDKVDELLTFELNHSTEVTVKGSVVPFEPPTNMPTPDITTNAEQSFENNNTRKDLIKDIKLKSLDISVQAPPEKTLSFLKEIYIYISTDSHGELLIAENTDIPKDVKSVSLETTEESLDKYVKSEAYNLRTQVVTREVITDDVILDVDLTFLVTAAPF